jgi:isopenicillin N synthase-like dioxygenase
MVEPLDVAPLFERPGAKRDRVDAAIGAAASTIGVLVIAVPPDVSCDPQAREDLLRVFDLPGDQQRRLWRRAYAPENRSIYRGWSPRSVEAPVDIYDLGPDVAHSDLFESEDPLQAATPLPSSALLPGWHGRAASYYRDMERIGATLMRSLARWLGLEETFFDDAFKGGISTLRLMRYEVPPSNRRGDEETRPASPSRGEHVDSGFVTLLAQHRVAGLQAQTVDGDWIGIPATEGHLVVNFGALLERWTSGRVRATPHRVVSAAPVRYSIPFFFEPRADTVVEPLPLFGVTGFEPFFYGDHLWQAMSAFPNFTGLSHLRQPRGAGAPTGHRTEE